MTKSELVGPLTQITTSSCWVMLKNSSSCPALAGNGYYSVCSIFQYRLHLCWHRILFQQNPLTTSPDVARNYHIPLVEVGTCWKLNRMKGNNVQSATEEHAQIPLLWPHIPEEYLKVFGYCWKDRGGDSFSFSMEILNLNALESALSVRLAPPHCWALQEVADIWDRADLTAHYDHLEGFQTWWVGSHCSDMFRGICKTFVHWTFEVKLIKYTNVLLPYWMAGE